jgi:hypothetical protein
MGSGSSRRFDRRTANRRLGLPDDRNRPSSHRAFSSCGLWADDPCRARGVGPTLASCVRCSRLGARCVVVDPVRDWAVRNAASRPVASFVQAVDLRDGVRGRVSGCAPRRLIVHDGRSSARPTCAGAPGRRRAVPDRSTPPAALVCAGRHAGCGRVQRARTDHGRSDGSLRDGGVLR